MPENNGMHTLTLENRIKASLTGILAVESFNEKQVSIKTDSECNLIISGDNLTVSKFNTENGTLVVEGKIFDIKYNEGAKAAGIIKKLFK